MDDLKMFFSPVSHHSGRFFKDQIGATVSVYSESTGFPDIDDADICIVGVPEDRGAEINKGTANGVDDIRAAFYNLFSDGVALVDLGNITPGQALDDTYYAVSKTVESLTKQGKTVILVGGSQDLTYAAYQGYENSEQLINLVCVDSRFDLGQTTDEELTNRNFLNNILLHQPNYLFNFSNVGYQTYFSSPEVVRLMDKLFFDRFRLGEIRSDIRKVEPLLRNADLISVDISAIEAAAAPGCETAGPNGIRPDEICQIARYAGLSSKSSCIGFFEYNPKLDKNGHTALLIAEMIWYFIDGVANRKDEMPVDTSESFIKFRVPVSGMDDELTFFKSLMTDRWWMHVPYPGSKGNRYRRHNIVPCSYDDYLKACEDNIPDLWMKTYRKYL